jgi:hypothetical protein
MGMLEALAGWVIPWNLPYTSGLSVAMPAVSHKQISSICRRGSDAQCHEISGRSQIL